MEKYERESKAKHMASWKACTLKRDLFVKIDLLYCQKRPITLLL